MIRTVFQSSQYARFAAGFAVVFMMLALAGCMDARALNHEVMKDQKVADKALKDIEPSVAPMKALTVDNRPWYGSRAVPLRHGESLPPLLTNDDGIVLTFERPMRFDELGRMIQSATGIRTITEGGDTNNPNPFADEGGLQGFLPSDGIEVSGGRIVWQGSLPALLNQIADSFDAQWEYVNGVLYIRDEITRTFMLHALADNITFDGDIANDSGEDGVLPTVSINSSATLEIWTEIQQTIESILNQRGRATFSPATGTINISGSPSLVRRAENYLRQQNSMRLRRVAVAVKVLSVDTSDSNTLTLNLNAFMEDLINDRPFQFTSIGTTGLSAGILTTATGAVEPDNDEYDGVFDAVENISRVSLVNSGAIMTLSDIPAPLQVGTTEAFIERVSAAGGDGGNVSLEPGEVNSGLTMNVLPRVIEEDRVLLRLAIGLTDLIRFETFEDNAQTIRIDLPVVDTTGFLQNAVLSEGETLVLAGFERNRSSVTDDGAPGGLFTGGERSLDREREVTVLLITAEVLPEDPLTVIQQ